MPCLPFMEQLRQITALGTAKHNARENHNRRCCRYHHPEIRVHQVTSGKIYVSPKPNIPQLRSKVAQLRNQFGGGAPLDAASAWLHLILDCALRHAAPQAAGTEPDGEISPQLTIPGVLWTSWV